MTTIGSLIISAAVSSAVITTVLQLLFRIPIENRLAEFKASLDLATQQLAAEQQQNANRAQMQFTWLHQKRAEVMLEIYQLVVAADDAHDDFLRSGTRFANDPSPDERWKAAVIAGEAFRKAYNRQKPLFPKGVTLALDRLNQGIVQIAATYRAHRASTGDENQALIKTMENTRTSIWEIRDVVEEVFRRLFGVEG